MNAILRYRPIATIPAESHRPPMCGVRLWLNAGRTVYPPLVTLIWLARGTGATAIALALLSAAPGCRRDAAETALPTVLPQPQSDPSLRMAISDLPRIDCSTSAEPPALAIACTLTNTPFHWVRSSRGDRCLEPGEGVHFSPPKWLGGRDWGEPDYAKGSPRPWKGDREMHPVFRRFQQSGTHQSYVNLIEDRADLIFAAREPSEDEQKLAEDKRVRLDIRPVALDGFVFITGVNNPVKGLTQDQIRRIYTGKITNWSKVGGRDEGIIAFHRDANSGSQVLMDRLVMKGRAMKRTEDALIPDMGGVETAIFNTPNGICFTLFYYEKYLCPQTRPQGWYESQYEGGRYKEGAADPDAFVPVHQRLAIDGVEASEETIANRRYPLTTEVYVVVREGAGGDAAHVVRDWCLSPAGQKVVKETGYVPYFPW